MEQQPEPGQKTFTFSVDTSGFVDSLWKVRAALLFGWNPQLVELDDELDIMYRGQL
jgi:hypothetical protein